MNMNVSAFTLAQVCALLKQFTIELDILVEYTVVCHLVCLEALSLTRLYYLLSKFI